MNLSQILKNTEIFVTKNSPTILTSLAVVGTVSTAYLTGKSTVKAVKLLEEYETNTLTDMQNNKDKIKEVWHVYIPPAISLTATVTCIVLANKIGNRRTAAMAAAYTISEKAFSEYKNKVVEKIGEKKEVAIRDEIAEERIANNPVSETTVISSLGDVLCYDMYAGRYFTSNMENIKKAQNDLNYQIINHNYASLTEFYSLLGLRGTKMSDNLGWNTERLLEISFSTIMSEDGRPCIAIDFAVAPIPDFWKRF